MFAVPGWSVSSTSLKRQTKEVIDVEFGLRGVDLDVDDESKPKAPKKRKRGNDHLAVTKDNVAELWEKIIERGGEKFKSHRTDLSERGKKKRQKQIKDSKGEGHAPDAEENGRQRSEEDDKCPSPIAEAERSSKKRRRTKETQKGPTVVQSNSSQPDLPTLTSTEHPIDPTPVPGHPEIKLTPLQASMRQKLTSARFRHLNQTLYTTSSADSFELFRENPEMFEEYHEGFRRQVAVWPENPLDTYVRELGRRAKITDGNRVNKGKGKDRKGKGRASSKNANDQQLQSLPRMEGICTIADLGCGDAKLARTMEASARKMKLQFHSYDLYSPNPFVTKADIANLPLKDGSVDVALFCLALMGTNWIDFIEEAYRILRWKGELWIAEIKSRFGRVTLDKGRTEAPKSPKRRSGKARRLAREENSEDDEEEITAEIDGRETNRQGVETDVSAFVEVLRRRGFALRSDGTAVDGSNKMFVKMYFVKRLTPTRGKGVPVSKAGTGDKPGGDFGQQKARTKFVEEDDGQGIDEAAVLKPCVYKIR